MQGRHACNHHAQSAAHISIYEVYMELINSFGWLILLAVLVIIILIKTAVVVPNQSAFVVERLGKFSKVLYAGFHILVPFVDVISYKRSLKE